MKTSDNINELAEALSRAQGEIKDATMDAKNPHFKNEYASLDSMLKEIRPCFSKHGLSFVQLLETDPDKGPYVLNTRIMHKSGQWIEGRLELILPNETMQGLGSSATYARRYSIQAVAGINQEKDDDGNAGIQPSSKIALPPQVKPKNTSPVGGKEVAEIVQLAESKGLRGDDLKEFIFDNFKISSSRDMVMWQADMMKDILRKKPDIKSEMSQ